MRQKSHGIEIEIHRNILLDNPRRDLHMGYHTLVAPQVTGWPSETVSLVEVDLVLLCLGNVWVCPQKYLVTVDH